jgi:hypothetical protein
MPAVGSGGGSNSFWTMVLQDMDAPVTPANIEGLQAWSEREGGGGAWNPLNTTRPAAGSTKFNSVGVQNYPNATVGAQATADSIKNGRYPSIVAAFMSGNALTMLVSGGQGPIGQQLRVWSGGGYNNVNFGSSGYISPTLGGKVNPGGSGGTVGPALPSSGTTSTTGSCQTLAETMANAGPIPGAQVPAFFVWITQGCVEKRLLIQGVSLFLILYGLKFMGHSEPIKIVTAPIGAAGKGGAMLAAS